MELAKNNDFGKIVNLINTARQNALQKVNKELVLLYWQVGRYISTAMQDKEWGSGYIDEMADYIQQHCPGIKGFNRRGLYRMKQFYEIYKDKEFVSTVLTQISWSNHLAIVSGTKTEDEREFYVQMCIKEKYSTRQLQRQLDSGYFERYMLSKGMLDATDLPAVIKGQFMDTYILEFLDLPERFSENDLQKAITQNLKKFILEMGTDFTFMGEEYKIQVGTSDFYIDLLFYHRELACLVAFELKIGAFKPEYIGKMDFYLEALDREYKKENENPSVGVILCAHKDDEVVEFALSRSLSPTLVARYQTKLIDKQLLRQKLHELTQLAEQFVEEDYPNA